MNHLKTASAASSVTVREKTASAVRSAIIPQTLVKVVATTVKHIRASASAPPAAKQVTTAGAAQNVRRTHVNVQHAAVAAGG